ncbi:uncharacterized protein BO95DRAFT_435923 [Aspergillus brunneoviolaceus CBS 621.78]|uniref:Uncharacterized protein n=2 Tax=Aspergillus TaxID=5052 RepID=A0A8G1RKF5_9EURO|nr:hypothetical protein BO95DRAFT_435923 [Aspergillus brunneoviolaceus CBS 621.78]XP_040798424.1 uncharacterized protein BO72DRAFT_488180 [Aspergillus fijiensis CBS 313.89]RAH41239.1 hypothetical protein BO95DRAFT_435923 [Aspergillus brunneoviolaceus CBS 621.78]RAK74414.1 hypothetical protein BO72DRAFT_488180 [Aspergillus fijiensis CBS 313.89]
MKPTTILLATILPALAISAAAPDPDPEPEAPDTAPDVDLSERADANPPKTCKINKANPPDIAPFWELPCACTGRAGQWTLGTDIKLVCRTEVAGTDWYKTKSGFWVRNLKAGTPGPGCKGGIPAGLPNCDI